MSNIELLPCPFCGGQVKLDEDDFYMFCCEECGAGITFAKEQDGHAEDCSREESIDKWNTRKPVERIAEQLEELDNNDWTPVEDGLPEETGYYLVTLSRSLPNEYYSNRVVVLFDGCENQFMCYENLIVAWMPLPELYNQAKEGKK